MREVTEKENTILEVSTLAVAPHVTVLTSEDIGGFVSLNEHKRTRDVVIVGGEARLLGAPSTVISANEGTIRDLHNGVTVVFPFLVVRYHNRKAVVFCRIVEEAVRFISQILVFSGSLVRDIPVITVFFMPLALTQVGCLTEALYSS